MRAIYPWEVTPEQIYLNRRQFMVGIGGTTAGLLLASCTAQTEKTSATPTPHDTPAPVSDTPPPADTKTPPTPVPEDTEPKAGAETDDRGTPLTTYESVTAYTNYYEFSLDPSNAPRMTGDFVMSPWEMRVGGLVEEPATFGMEQLLEFEQEERIYRMRCVETWAMVIPWVGFPLRRLLDVVKPTSEAKYVRFETVFAPEQMPGQKSGGFPWPYVEGLRLDEAMHDLTILATGIYGKPLTAQNGGPIRLVVPWKYGFKSIKSLVKIDLVEEMPVSLWMETSPDEYGFYANVNPDVPHPRWRQSTERLIGVSGRHETLMFNGYGDEVAHLYEGMDLDRFF